MGAKFLLRMTLYILQSTDYIARESVFTSQLLANISNIKIYICTKLHEADWRTSNIHKFNYPNHKGIASFKIMVPLMLFDKMMSVQCWAQNVLIKNSTNIPSIVLMRSFYHSKNWLIISRCWRDSIETIDDKIFCFNIHILRCADATKAVVPQ